jgi:WD40 repeat protein
MEQGHTDIPGLVLRRELHGPSRTVGFVSWSPDGRRLAVSAGQRSIRVLDPERDQTIVTLTSPAGTVPSRAAVIGEGYLKSENCLFERLQIAEHGDFSDRIFPIVPADAGIYKRPTAFATCATGKGSWTRR